MSIIGDSSKNSCLKITSELVSQAIQKKVVNYDRLGDEHYDTVSAFIKSVRGSDPDAAVYWLAKMLHAGEDLRFIMRRMLILASEDIGNADPNAIILASSCLNAVEFIGMPEARIILSQCATYLATAPKSNAAYLAIDNALSDIKKGSVQSVPKHLKDTHYSGSKALGSGEGYQYPHNYPNHFVPQKYLEKSKSYYKPSQMGFEATIQKRMAHWNKLRNESFSQKSKRGE